jgi:hypothetical protein
VHFELGQRQPYWYTLHNDMRALFICLFVFSLRPRTAGKDVLQKTLPWQRGGQAMQSLKHTFLTSDKWKDYVVPEAVQFLEGLWAEMFLNSKYDAVDKTHVFDLDKVLAILEGLGKEPGNSPITK